jgi:hypothetical protein
MTFNISMNLIYRSLRSVRRGVFKDVSATFPRNLIENEPLRGLAFSRINLKIDSCIHCGEICKEPASEAEPIILLDRHSQVNSASREV